MKLHKFQVKAIEDIIQDYESIKSSHPDVAVIVITRKKYNYKFKPLLHLDFDDVTTEFHPPCSFPIQSTHIDKIIEKLPEIKNASLVYVCCDAGISRSPAVAKALAHYLRDIPSFTYLAYRYPFANKDVFETALKELQRSKFRELNFQ